MKTNAALLWKQPGIWDVREVELDDPGPGEVLVEMVATGLCHSDDHYATGDLPTAHLPLVGGHEGAGIVRAVGPGVQSLVEGDHIVTTFIPSCGQCPSCVSGRGNLCDNGARVAEGRQLDGSFRMRVDGTEIATVGMLGTFAEWQVYDQLSCIKVPKDLPLETICLVACGVPTGFGSSTAAANLMPGDVAMVIGCGGVGMNAVQGAAFAGASRVVVVDPVEFKREAAMEFGATDAFATTDEALELVHSITDGQGAAAAVVTVGVTSGDHIADAFRSIRKAGTVVVTGMSELGAINIPVSLFELTMFQKRIQGCMFGARPPRDQIPGLLNLYRSGRLKLDELVTRRYSLDQINDAYADMHAGRNIRGVIDFRR